MVAFAATIFFTACVIVVLETDTVRSYWMWRRKGAVIMNQIWKNGMMGVVLGDCLGMPVQFYRAKK